VLLEQMHNELGSEAFARLWSSDDPFPAAFHMVRGEPLATWVQRYFLELIGPSQKGPITASMWPVVLVFVPAALAFGLRRRTGGVL
jgi:hypothetical protein